MKIALFLGAGASVPYQKPTTIQLKNELLEKYKSNEIFRNLLDYSKFYDIEYVLTALKQSSEFSTTLGGSFFKDHLGNFHHYSTQLKNLENIIENEIFEHYSWNHKDDEAISKILSPIFGIIKKKTNEIVIFTTNYDRAIEEYCSESSHNVRCIDGFQLNSQNNRFLWAKGDYGYMGGNQTSHDVFLYKLHGSLNWKKHSKYGIERTTYERKPTDLNYEEDFLIYPTLSPKEEANGKEPYKTIMKKFDDLFKELDVCIVIGFSFRDEHINEKFLEFTKRGKKLIIISPTAVLDFRIRVLKETPTDEVKKEWSSAVRYRVSKTPKDENDFSLNISFIQKKVEINTINEIVQEIHGEL